MTVFQFIVVILATWQIVEIWHHGEIFAGARARVEAWLTPFWFFFRSLLLCPFCLSVWVSFFVCLAASFEIWLFDWLINVFAVSRIANLLNDVFYTTTRTPGSR